MNTIIDGLIEESKKWIKVSSIMDIKTDTHAKEGEANGKGWSINQIGKVRR